MNALSRLSGLAIASCVGFAQPVHAEDGFDDGYSAKLNEPLSYAYKDVASARAFDRGYEVEVGMRLRRLGIPRSWLDGALAGAEDEGWPLRVDRPAVSGTALGAEVVIHGDHANGILYAEYLDSSIDEGYWDSSELVSAGGFSGGSYIRPSNGFGLLVLGADYAHEFHFVRSSDTQPFGVSLLLGGGFGLGGLIGDYTRWGANSAQEPAYKRALDGDSADSTGPTLRVYPLLDALVATRIRIGGRVSVRFEGGLHTLPYYGTSLGIAI